MTSQHPPTKRAHPVWLMTAALLMCAACILPGCTTSPSFDTEAEAMTAAEVDELAKTTDLDAVSSVTVADAPDARQDALVQLRRQGTEGSKAAQMLSEGFPSRNASVPVKLLVAPVDGVRSLVVIEAYGDDAGALSHRRLWVFDWETGAVIRSNSYH